MIEDTAANERKIANMKLKLESGEDVSGSLKKNQEMDVREPATYVSFSWVSLLVERY